MELSPNETIIIELRAELEQKAREVDSWRKMSEELALNVGNLQLCVLGLQGELREARSARLRAEYAQAYPNG